MKVHDYYKAFQKPVPKSLGLSLIEILMAIGIVSILAVLLIPKVITSLQSIQSNQISTTDQTLAQINQAVQSYTQQTGMPVNPDSANQNYQYILYNYGTYFIYKSYTPTVVTTSNPAVSYFQFMNGSRLSTTPQLFLNSSTFPKTQVPPSTTNPTGIPDYNASTLNATSWAPVGNASTASWCGDYDNNDCVYFDYNGSASPNNIGRNGDIIPFYIDPISGHIQTLYQQEQQDFPSASQADLCRFVSSYDTAIYNNQTIGLNANLCP